MAVVVEVEEAELGLLELSELVVVVSSSCVEGTFEFWAGCSFECV